MNSFRKNVPTRLRRQRGIGLVEVMIAMTLGIIVTGAVVQIYLSTKRQNDMQGGLSGRQEVSRYVAQLIQRDAQMAGYRGCLRDLDTVTNTLNDNGTFLYNFAVHVEGYEDGQVLPGDITAGDNDVVADTDVLTLRTVDDTGLLVTANMVNRSADPVTTAGLDKDVDPNTPKAGDIMLITDCGGAAVFQVTDYDTASGTIEHAQNTGAVPPKNAGTDMGRAYIAGAQLFKLRTTSYFIRINEDTNVPGLWRRIGDSDPVELAEGVENMQILYGEDTTGSDQVPDVYRTANNVANWNNVVSLQIALLVSSVRENVADDDPRTFTLLNEAAIPRYTDGRLRQVVTFTVAMRNRLS